MSTIVPKYDRVLVKREQLNKSTLIHIPEAIDKRNAPARGVIVAVGPTAGYKDEDGKIVDDLQVGSTVIFARHAGVEIEVGEEKFWVIQDLDVLCEIKE